ncbi:5-oxoprolinase subunit PxpB [Sporosarcina sp. FSL K6-1522]|uniref:5-oxoprolinase subunit PxpB n=1 Tax=Sporosarcina sp. FSL K6-1522 TaxID=2921554 RepID=UPI00315A9FB7
MKPNQHRQPQAMVTSERAIRFDFGSSINQKTYQDIQQFCRFIERDVQPLLEEVVPSMNTVTVFYRRKLVNPEAIIEDIQKKWANGTDKELLASSRLIDIPVCYDPAFSEDMQRIMEHTGLTRDEIIALHTGTCYTVYMIGFLPGFPYLGDLPNALHVPRLAKPRLRVPKGTVGIGGTQTGIYPIESPGGWNIIGRTPLDLYSLQRVDPFLIRAGDRLVFRAISLEVFEDMKNQLEREPERIQQFVKEDASCELI